MPRDGAGNYGLPAGNPVVTNTIISSGGWANPTMTDIASALTQSLSRDGQTTPTANLTMGNFRLTSLAAGTNRTDAINVGQVQDNTPAVLSSIAGTGDAITASTAPAITVYATDSKFVYTPTNANTLTNPTIAIDGLAAKTITQSNGVGLWSGALVVGTPYELLYDGTNFRVQSGALGGPIVLMQSPFAFRNGIIDGNFDFWSAGTSFTPTSGVDTYTADMWLANTGSGGACTVVRGVYTLGTEPGFVTTPAKYYLSFQQTGSASTNPVIGQKIESVAKYEGRSVTLSVVLSAAAPLTIPSVKVVQNFGTGGSPSGITTTTVTTSSLSKPWNVTTSQQKFSVRVDIPSISGKTLGTNGNDCLFVALNLPSGATFILTLDQFQIEECPAGAPDIGIPTPFEVRNYAIELQMRERYYKYLTKLNTSGFAVAVATSTTLGVAFIPIGPMRASPAISVSGGSAQLSMPSGNATAAVSMSDPQTIFMSATLVGATAGQGGFAVCGFNGAIVLDARL